MILFPAIDLVRGCAVRLYKGDYDQMTVYSESPWEIAKEFEDCGAQWLHLVDLEGARDGGTPNLDTIRTIRQNCGLSIEVGGGIRNMETVAAYINAGIDRVILGTAAVKDEVFLRSALEAYGEKIAVGVDLKDGFVAIKGWTEKTALSGMDFCQKMQDMGVKTIICTDISKDGAMKGTNRELYETMSRAFTVNITASGGVSSLEDVEALNAMGLYGAIIGKAYYTGAIDLRQALEVTK